MLIGRVSDGKETKRYGEGSDGHNTYNEYETANELYDIMAENHRYHDSDETLTASDLVILYKNLDIDTKLMTEAKYSQTKPSNQYVETIIYNDNQDSDDSDVGDIYSTEDIRNIMMINKERIDLLNNTQSYDTNLCPKLGNIAMNPTNLTSSYYKHFLFNDPFIKDQLNSFLPESNDSNILPTSLLDYICCKRLEDNYNFYMDSVITYVQHTIEHLKRISNGDYLTDKAKKKWREVVDPVCKEQDDKKNVLANSISIPLKVEPNLGGLKIWDDTVHSEVDVRSLSKILQKKIVLEIPKLICGTYKLFSKRYNDNLIIRCKKETTSFVDQTQSRVDVVLKLKKSDSGHVISKLNSIMILQSLPQTSIEVTDCITSEPLSLIYNTPDETKNKPLKIVEINDEDEVSKETIYESSMLTNKSQETFEDSLLSTDTEMSSISTRCRKPDFADTFMLYKNVIDTKTYNDEQTEANFCITSPKQLYCTEQPLNFPALEESEISVKKKKSVSKVRIKSPYENSSHAMEEKKRKRLLEIRERRENKKKALSENCKISKHKYAKCAVMAQSSSSVTKLFTITNKSFYNSIYGHALNNEFKNTKGRKAHNDNLKIVVELENCDEESQIKSPKIDKSKDKYINHSFYLDDADTEVMRQQMKQMSDADNTAECTAPSSVASDDFSSNLSLLKNLISPTVSLNNPTDKSLNTSQDFKHNVDILEKIDVEESPIESRQSVTNMVPTNTPKEINMEDNKKSLTHQEHCSPSVECRKSIDKIYDLMKKTPQLISEKNLVSSTGNSDGEDKYEECSIQPSNSGTSVKHHILSSIPSGFSFGRANNNRQIKKNAFKKNDIPTAVNPKLLIDTKYQATRSHDDKSKKDRKKINSSVNKISENPLKAISQLLHEFENVQKTRIKNGIDSKSNKRLDSENKNSSRQVTFKKPFHQEQHRDSKSVSRVSSSKEKKLRPSAVIQPSKIPNTRSLVNEKPVEKLNRRKVIDILDEVKEARGEAVRGPPKSCSRLDSLAQPKKSYIQAQSEQHQNRNMSNVLYKQQRVANNPTVVDRRDAINLRQKRRLEISQKPHSAVPPLGSRRSSSSSPDGNHKRSPLPATGPSHKPNVPEAPEALIKKMVAVESYVNNHYGRSSPIRDIKDFIGAQKSRVPLIPTDLDIGSVTSSRTAEESTTLGKKLHYMIDTMINTTLPVLTSLREQKESTLSKEDLNEAFVENMDQYDELISNTDFPIDIFGDKSITTAVASLPKDNNNNESILNSKIDFISYGIQPFNSTTELQRLENALYRRLSAATFQKRLRIKNLTLTPKHSLQQVFVLHSGDAGSVVVKSTLSQNFTKSELKTKKEIYTPTHSKSLIDWTFANFPKQFATVGYAVPSTYKVDTSHKTTVSEETKSNSENSKDNQSKTSDINSNKTKQCLNESSVMLQQQEDVQAKAQMSTANTIKPFQVKILENTDETDCFHKKLDDSSLEGDNKKSSKVINQREFNESSLSLISNNIDTTSLDILVGLLNEIKNITSCQTYITKHENSIGANECKELEFILKNAKLQEYSAEHSPQNALSFDSLKDVNENCNFCGSNSVNYGPLINSLPVRSDKEVSVSISGIEYVHRFTDVPSRFLPITVHHSTNVTSSLIGVISEPSEQSLYSFSDYQTLYCNSSFNRIIELPDIQSKPSIHELIQPVTKETAKSKVNKKYENLLVQLEPIEERRQRKKELKNDSSDFDAMLKIKRDILVTVYSILVMTVFAALSFPEILYRS